MASKRVHFSNKLHRSCGMDILDEIRNYFYLRIMKSIIFLRFMEIIQTGCGTQIETPSTTIGDPIWVPHPAYTQLSLVCSEEMVVLLIAD